jgi:hypothetical protein
MALVYKKAMGPHRSPMALHPISGMALWVTRFKIKIKEMAVKKLLHGFSLRRNIKHIG